MVVIFRYFHLFFTLFVNTNFVLTHSLKWIPGLCCIVRVATVTSFLFCFLFLCQKHFLTLSFFALCLTFVSDFSLSFWPFCRRLLLLPLLCFCLFFFLPMLLFCLKFCFTSMRHLEFFSFLSKTFYLNLVCSFLNKFALQFCTNFFPRQFFAWPLWLMEHQQNAFFFFFFFFSSTKFMARY